MGAAVDHRMDLTLLIPGHDDRRFADDCCAIVARLRDFDVETNIIPGTPPENPILFQLVDFRIGKGAIGRARATPSAGHLKSNALAEPALGSSVVSISSSPLSRQILAAFQKRLPNQAA